MHAVPMTSPAVSCKGPTPAPPIVLQEYVRAVQEYTERRQRLAQALHEPVKAWRLSPVIEALQALPGVQCTVAVPLVADMGARTRFDSPRALMRFLGLMPSDYSSGTPRRQGAIPKAGNTQARRVWGEGAWAYRYPAKVRRPLPLRLDKQPPVIQASRWKAQGRLCTRSRRRVARGQHTHVVPGARARERRGCMGAMAQEVPVVA
jgi:transposase